MELYSLISFGLHFWTVEDQFVRSRYFSYRFAAQSAEVYIGAQSLHTSSDDFVLVGELDKITHNREFSSIYMQF